MKLVVSIVFALLQTSLSTNEARSGAWSTMSTQAMEKVFARSEAQHKVSMKSMMRTMTISKAVRLLQKSHLNRKAVAEVTEMVHKRRSHLRQPKGYSGIEGARKMLNDMIY